MVLEIRVFPEYVEVNKADWFEVKKLWDIMQAKDYTIVFSLRKKSTTWVLVYSAKEQGTLIEKLEVEDHWGQ